MSYFRKKIYITILLGLSLFITSCSSLMPSMEISGLHGVSKNHVIIVGRVTMDPPFTRDDVNLPKSCVGQCGHYYKYVFLKITDQYYDVTAEDAKPKDSYAANVEGDFYHKYPANQDMNLLGVWLYRALTQKYIETMLFEIKDGVKITYPEGAKAIYIGDIYIKRNEFWEFEDFQIRMDDFDGASKRFYEKFGTSVELVPATHSSAY